MKKHNGIISIWKFLFSLMIVIYHGNILARTKDHVILSFGSIGVEFFFLVSGYLLAKSALSKKNDTKDLGKETIQFIFKKIKAFFPYILVCFILTLIAKGYYGDMSIKSYILSLFELLFVRMAGFKTTAVNGAAWYISAMLISMLLLYPLIRKYKYNYLYIMSPLIVLLVGGWLNQNYHSLRHPDLWIGFAYKGMIRSFIVLNLGAILYPLAEKVKNIKFTKLGQISITLIEIIGFIIPFIVSECIKKATSYDFIILIILSISIILAFSEKTLEYNICNNKVFYYLERLSLPIYLSQTFIRQIVNKCYITKNLSYLNKLGIYVLTVIIVSSILMFIIEKLKEKEYFIPKIKKLFICE